MGGESSNSGRGSFPDMPTGTESELLRIEGVQLYLLDGEESVRMGTGDLALTLIVQAHTPLATLVAQVAEFQWPIGKDGPVLKIANLRYTFAIPGLLYGLILPNSTPKELVQRLDSHLREFCTFEVCTEISKAAGAKDLRLWPSADRPIEGMSDGARYFTAVAEDVESHSSKLVQKVRKGSTAAANGILKGGEWATWGIKAGGSRVMRNVKPGKGAGGEEMSPRMQKRVAQARRMSAVAKLVSMTVLKGAISASGHVANFLGTAIGEAPPVRAFMSSDARREVAMASVDAFAKVVEAVETAGKSLAQVTGSVGTDIVQHKFGEQAGQAAQDGMGAMGNMIDSMWTLNKVGLHMLWGATTASTVLNANRPTSRSPSGASDVSMQSIRQTSSSAVSPVSLTATASSSRQQPSSVSPAAMALSPPTTSQQDDMVLCTAQLFPSGPSVRPPTSPLYAGAVPPPPNMFMQSQLPPGYVFFHPTPHHPNSPFQHYTRPPAPPQVQPFFPFGMDVSKTQ